MTCEHERWYYLDAEIVECIVECITAATHIQGEEEG